MSGPFQVAEISAPWGARSGAALLTTQVWIETRGDKGQN